MISGLRSVVAGACSGVLVSESTKVALGGRTIPNEMEETEMVQINLVHLLTPWTNWRAIFSSTEGLLAPSIPAYAIPLTISATHFFLKPATAKKLLLTYRELRAQEGDSSWKILQIRIQKPAIRAALKVRGLLGKIPFFSSGIEILRNHMHLACAVALVAEGGFALLHGQPLFTASVAGGAALSCIDDTGHFGFFPKGILALAGLVHSLISGDLVQKSAIFYIVFSNSYGNASAERSPHD